MENAETNDNVELTLEQDQELLGDLSAMGEGEEE